VAISKAFLKLFKQLFSRCEIEKVDGEAPYQPVVELPKVGKTT
jgi:hypothetical protein